MTEVADPANRDLGTDEQLSDNIPADATPADGVMLEPALVQLEPTETQGPVSFVTRVGRRIVRRPLNWIDAPWPLERIVRASTAFGFLLVTGIIALKVVHWDLITTDNTPTGGDMGAHVMGPAYLRDHLLSNFRLSGWNPYWYDGFPMYRFYMVVPALMIVVLNTVLSYGVAFKIVVVLGIMSLPACCWAFGRLAKFVFPIPELFALAGLVFLLDESFSIYGGNVKSTMAGEFSFSIALSFAVLGLGLFAHGLETGKFRGRTAVVLALAVLSHGIVAIFVVVAIIMMMLIWVDRERLIYGITTLLPAALLAGFWIIPFVRGTPYMTDMKYGKRPEGANDSYWKMFFNLDVTFDRIIFVFAAIGLISAIVRRHRTGTWLGVTILALCVLTRLAEQSLPIIGLLWNPRVLPFIYLLRYLLMMVGIAEVGRGVTVAFGLVRTGLALQRERRAGRSGAAVAMPTGRSPAIGGAATAVLTFLVIGTILMVEFEVAWWGSGRSNGRYALAIGSDSDSQLVLYAKRSTNGRGLSDSWSQYNFKGYESKPAYGEYRGLITAMDDIGHDPKYGCGRALWENNGENGKYGTTMALMLLPHWTDGCIGSSEGLFFEASGTTPYHFIAAAAMSSNSSNPVRQLRYTDNDPAVGVPYLQKLGIKYYMAWTEKAVAKAEVAAGLTPIAQSGPWHIYEVAESAIVVPLKVQPVVVKERPGDQRERWLELGSSWFQNPDDWVAVPAAAGPAEWQRITSRVDVARIQVNQVEVLEPAETITPVELPDITVSNVVMGNESVSFDVDQVGVPVLVKVSYFPNWEAEGATGPYRVAPNLMVVVPTSKHVTLRFARTFTDYFAYFCTLLGVVLIFVFRKFVPIRYPAMTSSSASPPEPSATTMVLPSVAPPEGSLANEVEVER